jgi:hypothetical protein
MNTRCFKALLAKKALMSISGILDDQLLRRMQERENLLCIFKIDGWVVIAVVTILDAPVLYTGLNFSVPTQNNIMNTDKDKQQGTDKKHSTQQQGQEQEQNVHFDKVSETYGSDETIENEAAAEQQRKEALTERD